MSVKERLKNNPWLTDKKYPLFYIPAIVVPLMIFLLDGAHKGNVTNIVVPFVFYFLYALVRMLRTNFYIYNHRTTPLFGGAAVGIVTIFLMCVLVFDAHNYWIAITLLPLGGFIITLIYIYSRLAAGARLTLLPFALLALFLSGAGYFIIADRLAGNAGNALFIIAGGGFLFLVILTLHIYETKMFSVKSPSFSSLEARFDKYLNKIFKNLYVGDELTALWEQLSAALISYAEKNIDSGLTEDKIFFDAVDSLGDYSDIISSHKKNIFSRISGFSNKITTFIVSLIIQAAVSLYFMTALSDNDWAEAVGILFLVPLIGVFILSLLRVVSNFSHKKHKYTPLFIGILLIISSFLTVFMFYMTYKEEIIFTVGIVSVASLVVITAAVQIVILVCSRRKNGR